MSKIKINFSEWKALLLQIARNPLRIRKDQENVQLLLGKLHSERVAEKKSIRSLSEVEFSVFSQFGDDGIIQWLIRNIEIKNTTFIEFGVEDYWESNTRFLLLNDNWRGLIIDGSTSNISEIKKSDYYWKHHLTALPAFIDRSNINDLILSGGLSGEIGILHIDLDGNDYWIWESISTVDPAIVIMEYNSVFGNRPITIPYDPSFIRSKAHYSNLYFGASLSALDVLAQRKGYRFIGTNSAGNNAYFVKENHAKSLPIEDACAERDFVMSKFRESRDRDGRLTYLNGEARLAALLGLPVWNVETETEEKI